MAEDGAGSAAGEDCLEGRGMFVVFIKRIKAKG
jgi:hypothetical protein